MPKKPPKVTVLDPALEIPHGEELPHVYPGEELCLCYPWEWDESQLIAHTVVPWASEWLFHYEIWKATGTWCGGGHVTSLVLATGDINLEISNSFSTPGR